MKRKSMTMAVALLATTFTFLQADVNMKEGLWEMTVQTQMSGMPMQIAIPPTTFTQCITKKDLIPKDPAGENGQCKILDQKISGDTVTWTMECKGESTMKAVGFATYHGDTFEGVTDITSNIPQMGLMKMKQTIKGKYVGACKK
jgi:hypothetical protein